jgi:hypothetical protein
LTDRCSSNCLRASSNRACIEEGDARAARARATAPDAGARRGRSPPRRLRIATIGDATPRVDASHRRLRGSIPSTLVRSASAAAHCWDRSSSVARKYQALGSFGVSSTAFPGQFHRLQHQSLGLSPLGFEQPGTGLDGALRPPSPSKPSIQGRPRRRPNRDILSRFRKSWHAPCDGAGQRASRPNSAPYRCRCPFDGPVPIQVRHPFRRMATGRIFISPRYLATVRRAILIPWALSFASI